MTLPNFQQIEDQLYSEGVEAIIRFGQEHGDDLCSFFAYDVDPLYGNVFLSFDTFDNSIKMARENEQQAIARRANMLNMEWSWQSARRYSTDPLVLDYSPDIGHFAYADFRALFFPEWEEVSDSEHYPRGEREPDPDDYMEGNLRIVLWKAIERLIASDAFAPLCLASPFRVGYQLHERELVVLRILNWPAASW
jgi:hypothetical protein